MNIMNMPGFTAEASVYKSNLCCSAKALAATLTAKERISMAMMVVGGNLLCNDDWSICVPLDGGGGGGDGRGGGGGDPISCYNNCERAVRTCRTMCRGFQKAEDIIDCYNNYPDCNRDCYGECGGYA